jgi:hypothetical protein
LSRIFADAVVRSYRLLPLPEIGKWDKTTE